MRHTSSARKLNQLLNHLQTALASNLYKQDPQSLLKELAEPPSLCVVSIYELTDRATEIQ